MYSIMDMAVFDVETTGLDPDDSEIIAFGISPLVRFEPRVIVRRKDEFEPTFVKRITGMVKGYRVLIGYCSTKFDVPFIMGRWNGIVDFVHVDLCEYVELLFGRRLKLSTVVDRLFPCRNYGDRLGHEMPKLWSDGRINEIAKHQLADVERTWLLANYFLPIIITKEKFSSNPHKMVTNRTNV